MMVMASSPFGGRARSAVLVALRLLGQSYPRELARLLDARLSGVQQALRGLESDGLVSARLVGRTRLYCIDTRYFAYDELQRYLIRLAEPERGLRRRIEALRRKTRRTGESW